MGISPIDSNCSKHPNLKQIPGVCSSCLREKLSKLTSSTHTTFTDFSSAAIFHSSSPEFSPTPPPPPPPPPPQGGGGHRRIGSATATMTKNGIGLLKKSRSVTCGGRMKRRGDEEEVEEEEDEGEMIELDLSGSKKKKSGFWWRLIRSTGKKMSGIKQR